MHTTDLFFRGYRNHPERLALSGDGGDFTYRQAYGMANRIARRLRDAGFGPGDRFAVLSPNSSRAFLSMLGGMRAGVAWCNLNMKAALPDILHILAAGKCNLLFFDQSAAPMLADIRKAVPTLREAVCIGGTDPSRAHARGLAGRRRRRAAGLPHPRGHAGLPGRHRRHHRPLQAHRGLQPFHADQRDGLVHLPALRRAAGEPGGGADHARRRLRRAGHGAVQRHHDHDGRSGRGSHDRAHRAAPRQRAVPAAHADLHAAGAPEGGHRGLLLAALPDRRGFALRAREDRRGGQSPRAGGAARPSARPSPASPPPSCRRTRWRRR